MAANTQIYGKVFNIATTGFVTSLPTVIQGWVQYPSAATGHRAVVVDRQSQTALLGVRAGAGVAVAATGLYLFAPNGLSCTTCSAGAVVTVYVR